VSFDFAGLISAFASFFIPYILFLLGAPLGGFSVFIYLFILASLLCQLFLERVLVQVFLGFDWADWL
jgi:low affinity Fe/Cu permease